MFVLIANSSNINLLFVTNSLIARWKNKKIEAIIYLRFSILFVVYLKLVGDSGNIVGKLEVDTTSKTVCEKTLKLLKLRTEKHEQMQSK